MQQPSSAGRPWGAPSASGPVSGTVIVPGSKSATARAYVLAALADGASELTGVLDSRDTSLMRAALEVLGVRFEGAGPGRVRVSPPASFTAGPIEVGLAGTIMRFVPPLAALADGASPFTGDPEAAARPVFPLLDGLRQIGVRVEHPESLPFVVHGTGRVPGGRAVVDASGSSQFVSGLLLGGCRFEEGLELTHRGGALPSLPYVSMTVEMLRERGVTIAAPEPQADDLTWRVDPGPIAARDETIEPDLMNAAVFLAAGAITGGSVSMAWPRHTLQAAERILEVFEALGARVTRGDETVTVTGGEIAGADLDLSDASELTCIVAAMLATASGPSRIRGVAHIRGHETDRLAALEAELSARGASVRQTADGLEIDPKPLSGGAFHTYADHRMAHAASVLGLVVPGVELDDVACTTKTMADFPGLWEGLVR